jgi:hypothetical protein
MSPLLRKVLRLALKSNNNHGSHPVPADFFTQWRAGAQIPAWGGPGPFLARRVTRSPRRHTGSRWNKSHPKSAKAHFASAPQNMLPRRCWNEPHSRRAGSLVGSTAGIAVRAPAGHQLRPPRGFAQLTLTNHPHQSGQRDSNPRHSAWETRVLGCACARKCLAVLRSRMSIARCVPFVSVVSRKVCTSVYRRTCFDELGVAVDVVRARMKHNPAKRGLGRVGWLCVRC